MKYANYLKWIIVLLTIISISQSNANERSSLSGQLFFIAGTPETNTPLRFPTVLYGVDDKKRLKRLRPITTQAQGAEFIWPYYDDDLILIGNVSQQGFFQLDYINMNNVMQEKSYEIELCKGCSYSRSYHLKKNGKLSHQIIAAKLIESERVELSYHNLNYSDGIKTQISGLDLGFARAFGTSSGNFNGDQIQWLHAYNDKPTYYDTTRKDLTWSFPQSYKPKDRAKLDQSINNDLLISFFPHEKIKLSEAKGQQLTHYIFDKNSQQWSSITLTNSTWLRGFGQWLVTEEQYLGFNQQVELSQLIKQRQKQKIGILPYRHVLERFKYWDIRKTGLLHLINPVKNIHIEIKTGKPDSEIILVENNLVVYRVDDQIYTAEIAGTKILNTQLLLRHDMVPAIHWAFMGKM